MTCPNPCYSGYSYNRNYYYDNSCSTSSSYCYEDPCMPRRRCEVLCNQPSLFEYLFTPTCPSYSSSWYTRCPRVVRREPINGGGSVLMLVIFLIMGVLSLANHPKRFYC